VRKLLGIATAVALSTMAFTAAADEAKGMVEKLDAATSTFWIGDKQFIMSNDATGNVTLDELKDGDTVTVEFTQNQGSDPNNVMRIEKE
jgi:hypothetical protein